MWSRKTTFRKKPDAPNLQLVVQINNPRNYRNAINFKFKHLMYQFIGGLVSPVPAPALCTDCPSLAQSSTAA
jgi:hypothetical protein